jgi:hypothetical protein
MKEAIRSAIIQAAEEVGMDPATALAIAERESSFNPNAHSSSTIHGLFQMQGGHRARYGIGNSNDPAVQTKGWVPFFRNVQKEMAGPLGRDPTDAEGYLGHHFGGVRAGRMLRMDPSTPVQSVFTQREMAENPHFARAGTVGRLNSSILDDIQRRQAKFGGSVPEVGLIDFAKFGEPVDTFDSPAQTVDFSANGDPVETFQPPSKLGGKIDMASAAPSNGTANLNMGSKPAEAPDFSSFGEPVT